uniref:Putative ovule protein n=1 Tax=Solanum chacoense TaxID=4108 RepID=A0A0V0GRF4_SOLCH
MNNKVEKFKYDLVASSPVATAILSKCLLNRLYADLTSCNDISSVIPQMGSREDIKVVSDRPSVVVSLLQQN